ncbi:F0F1 ATP synthase subunit epsilon [Clostridium sp.]|uniref:F0F1 ATP synthase subunit epsilon n=1 Tax=Clostridium sp. TaxID=1506 RepID=UPI003464C961
MEKYLNLNIITPENKVFQGEVKKVFVESIDGKIQILPSHIDMITLLKPTITEIVSKDGEGKKLFTSNGIIRISNGNIYINCDAAEWPEEIDRERATRAKERAEERLKSKDNIDTKRAESALYRALTRLSIA